MNLHEPTVAMISHRDIAHGLSKICRFGGQIRHFYSVAQHSVIVSRKAPESLKKAALIHDFSEAYLGDVIKPLKVMLGTSYSDIEERFMRVICDKFKVPYDQLNEIKELDRWALQLEHECFQLGNEEEFRKLMQFEMHSEHPFWSPKHSYFSLILELEYVFGKEVLRG